VKSKASFCEKEEKEEKKRNTHQGMYDVTLATQKQ
jgi:hypothetical protein